MINHQPVYRSQSGFTLIETIIYLTLFSMLFSGILMSAYTLITSAEHIGEQVATENESAFVVHKISTLLASASTIIKPIQNMSGDTLTFLTYAGDEYTVTANEGVMMLAINGETSVPLTSERTTFTTFSVGHKAAANGTSRYIEYSFVVNSKDVWPIRNYFTF